MTASSNSSTVPRLGRDILSNRERWARRKTGNRLCRQQVVCADGFFVSAGGEGSTSGRGRLVSSLLPMVGPRSFPRHAVQARWNSCVQALEIDEMRLEMIAAGSMIALASATASADVINSWINWDAPSGYGNDAMPGLPDSEASIPLIQWHGSVTR